MNVVKFDLVLNLPGEKQKQNGVQKKLFISINSEPPEKAITLEYLYYDD